jgi:Domain of unknown function (DUF5076)
MRPLLVPPAAQRDDESVQMLSAWIAENGLHCTLHVGMWQGQGRSESSAWGILLADVIRHIGNAMQVELGADPTVTVNEVVRSTLAELEQPTSPAQGGFHVGHS